MLLRTRFAFTGMLLSFALVGVVGAAPIACPESGNYADLMATNGDGGCLVQDKVFSNFTYLSSATGGATAVDADDFNYNTVENAPIAVGFSFQFALTALANQTNDVLLGWLVTGPNIASNHLSMTGNATGSGAASIVEIFCKGGPIAGCPGGSADGLFTYANPPGAPMFVDAKSFPVVTQLGVSKNLNVSTGPNGFATISGMTQTVDQIISDEVPEPGTMFLGGLSLIGLGMFRRFRN